MSVAEAAVTPVRCSYLCLVPLDQSRVSGSIRSGLGQSSLTFPRPPFALSLSRTLPLTLSISFSVCMSVSLCPFLASVKVQLVLLKRRHNHAHRSLNKPIGNAPSAALTGTLNPIGAHILKVQGVFQWLILQMN